MNTSNPSATTNQPTTTEAETPAASKKNNRATKNKNKNTMKNNTTAQAIADKLTATAAAAANAAIGGTWQDATAAAIAHAAAEKAQDAIYKNASTEAQELHKIIAYWLDQIGEIPADPEDIDIYSIASENAENGLIYFSDIQKFLDSSRGCDIDEAEQELADIYGDDIFTGCASLNEANQRVARQIKTTRNLEELAEVVDYLKALSND